MASLFDTLINERLITAEQLSDARAKQVGAKKSLHELLVEMGFIKEEDLLKVVSKVYNMPLSDLDKELIDPSVITFRIFKFFHCR